METNIQLNLAVDMNGCPNRCLHCWLGHMPNKRMGDCSDRFIMDCFSPFFRRIAFYSWLREPDFCDDYVRRWEKDLALSKGVKPKRFELASFWRIVRDDAYIPFLRSVGVKKVQLTLFGLKDTQDRYVGRSGAFEEVLGATDRLIQGGVIPRWQCFINEENRDEIVELLRLCGRIRRDSCPDLELFVHEGTCDGENRRLYPIRIQRQHVPAEVIPVYLNWSGLLTEKECCGMLKDDLSAPAFPVGNEITLNISNEYDVYYNYTNMSAPWIIGNLKTDPPGELVRRIVTGDTAALRAVGKCTWSGLVDRFGDFSSDRVFSLEDYQMYLINNYLENLPAPGDL
ncbi:MAG: radical SAM protein [Oscillospiraceae bacterium]|nr:radical SAM protein [Oscillospiraceae bacterium]